MFLRARKYEVIPAVYKTVEKQVCDVPASTKYEVIPAVYKTVEKQVCVTEESKKKIEIPAVYKTVSKEVCDQLAARKVWRLTDCKVPVPVSKCEEKKCDTCSKCCGEPTEFMYEGNYNDGKTQHIAPRKND